MRRNAPAVMIAAVLIGLAACGGGDDAAPASSAPTPSNDTVAGPPRTLRVPDEYSTIQAAVDDARPDDLVLLGPGTYHEAVLISTPRVTLRGADRNAVVLDGRNELGNGVMVVGAGSVVENLTVTGYTFNGVLVTSGEDAEDNYDTASPPLEGYRVSYVTAYNNGLYGIYAFAARGGRIEHSYASGHPDAGIYVGQCDPCDVLVTDNVAENNYIGYEGTNAGGSTFIVDSVWRNNRVGVTINSQDTELLAPQDTAVVAGNLIAGNDNAETPARPNGTIGVGVAISGGTNNLVTRNRIADNAAIGVALTDLDEYAPSGNQVLDNVITGNAVADLALYSSGSTAVAAQANCFSGNRPTLTWPDALESMLPCGQPGTAPPQVGAPAMPAPPPGADYQNMPAPAPQASMPDAIDAPATAASAAVPTYDVAGAVVPAG